MDSETAVLTDPELEAIEGALVENHDEFMELTTRWSRAWQRAMVRRAMQRKRAKASLAATNDEADKIPA